jgi:uncharacterized membrane protein (TIGR02234 family)
MTTGRERLAVLALGVVGAGLALLTAGRTWLTVTVSDPLVGSGRLSPDGRSVASLVPAAALVGLAGVVAAVTLRRVGRYVAGLLLVVAGGAIGAAAVSVLLHPRGAAADSVGRATGRVGDTSAVAHATPTVWPWLAVVAALPLVLAGAVTLVRGRSWSGLSGRYDAPSPGLATAAGPVTRSAQDSPPAGAPPSVDESADASAEAWDALSRGEDPTG